MRILIRGAGDLASGIALRLYRAGFTPILCDLPQPTAIRRTVCFSEAVYRGETAVEDIIACHAALADVPELLSRRILPVLTDSETDILAALRPDVLVDAIIAKKNLGTRIDMAPVVIAAGPGFVPGMDCHAVVETMRGHTLGRVYYDRPTIDNTAVPGLIGGFAGERVLRAPADGVFRPCRAIGDRVHEGETVAYVEGLPMVSTITGILRGILPDGITVTAGMKSGDVDPRCQPENCTTVSDKALAVGGGVLEAILHFSADLHL